ncbi:MAG TPA: hypothetical protein DDY14_12965 [Chromatiaceae bacterium]|jgi:hypothetical protein|nr:MAG: hypothetical protein N838_24075 [Thiohalocapsa sp. PB-PSB1]QQO52349.1 MAG: hypothetical protein N838_02050 [Thiohalocapsa sp. PB-PSB1]HBG96191.1 hypothetical protein [Chromatiaceae bacterium]HCS89533.1 hypothetical protein [Chromatiaceae bacterium]
MLSPSKHAHPDKTVVAVATILLERLRQRRTQGFDDLRRHLASTGNGGDTLYLPALDLLFLLGLVEYHPKTDAFEYLGR